MDIKEKFKEFIDKQKLSIKSQSLHSNPSENISLEDFKNHIAVSAYHPRQGSFLDEHCLTPEAEQAVIESIDSHYFDAGGVDVGEEELKKFPDISDIHVINGIRSRLRKQQSIVTRRASNLIMQKQGLCAEEIKKLSELQHELCKCINLCTEGRTKLQVGRCRFTSASLGILSSYSKRQRVANVIDALRTIHTLQMTDVQLQKLLKAEDYPGAIQLLLECQQAAETFKHFKCISELSTKLQNTLEMTEEQLDCALSKVALHYSCDMYEKLFVAYGLFGKTQTMMDQLHMHLTSHIHNSAFTIVLGYVELYNNKVSPELPSYAKLQYSELCKYIHEECFLSCFLDLSKSMWHILKNYHNIMKFHSKKEFEHIADNNVLEEPADDETEITKKYIKQKLDHGLIRIWQDVQAKVRTYILASNLSHFKFDDFLKVLAVINKVIDVGEAFCGSKSETLHDSIKKQSFSFFCTHHLARMEELHMFLENEGWEICPVKSNFSISKLIEPNFFKNQGVMKPLTPGSTPKKGAFMESKRIFDFYETGSPFDMSADDSIDEDIMSSELTEGAISDDSDEDVPEELKRDFVDEHTGDSPQNMAKKKQLHNVPMTTNTTVTILKLVGKYIQMMGLLQPIAFDVLICLKQLFEYFLYAVFVLFSERKITDPTVSPKLQETLQRIEENLILNPDEDDPEKQKNKLPSPSFSHNVLSDGKETLFDLPVRVIAVESLDFLAQQLESLHPKIEVLIPATKADFLQQFYTYTVKMTSEVRYHVYSYVTSRLVDYEALLTNMVGVRWDVNDLKSEHSSYVDVLLRQLQVFALRLEELQNLHPLPQKALNALWDGVIRQVNRTLLEGFASSKKCTNEGRSLMQLDYQQFLMKLEGLTTVRPIPDRSLVDTYIKAYYLPEGALFEWVQGNLGSYSSRQLIMLVNCMTHVGKRTRQKIVAVLEENSSQIS